MASFNEAFRSARAGGKKSFSWQGKTYSTELAKSPGKVPVPTKSPAKTGGAKTVNDVAKKSSPGMQKYMADKGYTTGKGSGPATRSAKNAPKGYMADAGPARTKGGQSDARKMPTRKG